MKTLLTLIALVYISTARAELIEQTIPSDIQSAIETHYNIGRVEWDCCGISQIRLFNIQGEVDLSISAFIKKTLEKKSEMSASLQAIQSICNGMQVDECMQTLMYFQDDRDWNDALTGYAFDGSDDYFKAYLAIESFLNRTLSNNTITKTYCNSVYRIDVCDTLIIDVDRNLLVYIAHDGGA
jgi:hypothetical protein